MATANEVLHHAAIDHAVDLTHYSNGVVAKIIATLNRTDAALFADLIAALERLPADSFTVDRLEQLLYSVRALNRQAYDAIGRELSNDLRDLTVYESEFQLGLFKQAVPSEVVAQVGIAPVNAEAVYAAAMSRPFQGVLLKGVLVDLEFSRTKRIRETIASGYVSGETTDQMVRKLRGTRALRYEDGIFNRSRSEVEAVVRTAVSHTAEFTRERFYDANAKVIASVQWVSTLDNRTSPMCRIRDGLKYTLQGHKPIGHTIPWGAGPGALHWCCRSTSTPVTKSWKELTGADVEEFSPATRASMDGQVPADMTYSEWLAKQSAKRQDEILGKAKGAMFRTGKLPLAGFYNDKGKALTLEELKAQQPAAYQRAGLDLPFKPPLGQRKDEIALFLESQPAQAALLDKLYTSQRMIYDGQLLRVKLIKKAEGYSSTDESLAAVRYYTGEGYATINRRMRETGGTLEDRQFAALTVSSFPGIGEFKGEIWRAPTTKAARADVWWDKAEIGQPMDMGNQIQSFSRSAQMSANWATSSDVLLRVGKSQKGVYIEPLSQNQGEHEVLLPPGLTYRVVGKSTMMVGSREFRVIDLEIEGGE